MFRILLTSIFLYSFSLSSLVSAVTMQFSFMDMDHSMMNMSYGNNSFGGEKTEILGELRAEDKRQDMQQTQNSLQNCIEHCLSDMGMGVFLYGYFSVDKKEKIHTKNNFLTQTTTLYHRTSIPPLHEDENNQKRKKIIQQSQRIPLKAFSPYENYVGTTLLSL